MKKTAAFTLVEVLVASALALLVALVICACVGRARRMHAEQADRVDTRSAGRAAVQLLASDLRLAGYSPLGVPFDALPSGDADRLRILADRDGDGIVGCPGEADENLSYVFARSGAAEMYELRRGVVPRRCRRGDHAEARQGALSGQGEAGPGHVHQGRPIAVHPLRARGPAQGPVRQVRRRVKSAMWGNRLGCR